MAFSCKIILSDHIKEDGKKRVYLQAIIDRARVIVPVGFYLNEKDFDNRGQMVRQTCTNHETYNAEIAIALTNANNISSQFRIEKKRLTTKIFKAEFSRPSDRLDFTKFFKARLESSRQLLAPNTVKQHVTVINKLAKFRGLIDFAEVDGQFIEAFKVFLLKKEANSLATVNKLLKIVKHYTQAAIREKRIKEDPFVQIRIKEFKSNRVALSQNELTRLHAYYLSEDCKAGHRKVLQYFLFSCFTGVRISDVKLLTWENVNDGLLSYIPEKTKSKNEPVIVPLGSEMQYLPKQTTGRIFRPYADQVVNRTLKKIAAALDIPKKVSYHTSRHTFGTLMAETGHLAETQKMMGHGSIKTSMGYIHTSHKNLIQAKKKMFSIPIKNG
jgi:integrase